MIKCDTCWDMGERLCEDTRNNERLFSWPCPHGCAPGGLAIVRTTVAPSRAKKLGDKMRKVRPE